jgi:hypothetical protein
MFSHFIGIFFTRSKTLVEKDLKGSKASWEAVEFD